MRRVGALIAALFIAVSLAAPGAAAADCQDHLLGAREPQLTNSKLVPKTRQLCYSEFALLHSGVTRTPLWVAEHISQKQARAASKFNRAASFHIERNLPEDERAKTADYERSGYDLGHMAPAGNMGTAKAMRESFSLANMVPQAPRLNRVLWRAIEKAVLDHVLAFGELYVVSGPIFSGDTLSSLNDRVLVPTHVFKAVYDPASGKAAAYLAENRDDAPYGVVSLAQLEDLSGIDVFPGLSAAVKRTASELPQPSVRRPRSRGTRAEAPLDSSDLEPVAPNNDFVAGILEAIDRHGRGQ